MGHFLRPHEAHTASQALKRDIEVSRAPLHASWGWGWLLTLWPFSPVCFPGRTVRQAPTEPGPDTPSLSPSRPAKALGWQTCYEFRPRSRPLIPHAQRLGVCSFGVPPAPETGDSTLSLTPARARPGPGWRAELVPGFQTCSRAGSWTPGRALCKPRSADSFIDRRAASSFPFHQRPSLSLSWKVSPGTLGRSEPRSANSPSPAGGWLPWLLEGSLPSPAGWSLCPLRPLCSLHPSVPSPLYNSQPPFHPLPPPPPCTPLRTLGTLPTGLRAGGPSLVPSSWLSRLLGLSLT